MISIKAFEFVTLNTILNLIYSGKGEKFNLLSLIMFMTGISKKAASKHEIELEPINKSIFLR